MFFCGIKNHAPFRGVIVFGYAADAFDVKIGMPTNYIIALSD